MLVTERPMPLQKLEPGNSVIDAFNAAHSLGDLLERYGYVRQGKDRYLPPESSTGLAGAVIYQGHDGLEARGSPQRLEPSVPARCTRHDTRRQLLLVCGSSMNTVATVSESRESCRSRPSRYGLYRTALFGKE